MSVALAGCSSKPVEVVETREAMSTIVTVRVAAASDAKAREALKTAWQEMEFGIAKLDWHREPSKAWLEGKPEARRDPGQAPSDVWRINQDAGKWAAEVDPMVTGCLAVAKEVNKLSGGAFDPTVLPVLKVWREAARQNKMPSDEDLAKALALVGMDKVEIVADMVSRPPSDLPIMPPGSPPPTPDELVKAIYFVQLSKKGMGLDLGGIAKGFIVGRMAERVRQLGVKSALVQAGGDIFALGERPPRQDDKGDRRWGVGVQDPRSPDDPTRLFTVIRVRDQAVTTSGHYYRGYTVEGKRFSHIIDPRTGRPVDTRVASVTVVARDGAVADGLGTAVAVMGIEKGMAMIEELKDVECLILEAVPPGEGASSEPKPNEVRLIPHRSKGFAAMEYKPEAEDAAK